MTPISMKNFVTFIFIGALIGLGILVGRGNPGPSNQTPSAEQSSQPSTSDEASTNQSSEPLQGQGGGGPTGRLYAFAANQADHEIVSITVANKDRKVIYSDKGQARKITAARITRSGDSVILVLSPNDDPAGQLVSISTKDPSKKTVLAETFLSTTNPEVSPDQSKLAFASFSNADPHYGFTLSISDINGQHRKDLVTDASGISHLSFSPDGKQIAFIKGAAAGSNQIAVVAVDSGKVSTLYDFKDKVIEDFDWSPTGILTITAVGKTNATANQSEVYLIDPKTKAAAQLTKNNQPERSPRIAPDGSGIAFIQLKTEKTTDLTKSGDITITTSKGEVITTLGTGLNLLGWVAE